MKVEIQSKQRVLDAFFKIDEAKLRFEKFDGTMSPVVTRLCFERGDSVAAIVHNVDTQTLLLVNQFKYPSYDKGPGWITEVVAGMISKDEDPAAAMRREIQEEMGYQVSKLEPISIFYVSPGGSSERIMLFYAAVTSSGQTGPGGGLASEQEDIRVLELTRSQARKALKSNQIQDAKTIISLMWVEENWSRLA